MSSGDSSPGPGLPTSQTALEALGPLVPRAVCFCVPRTRARATSCPSARACVTCVPLSRGLCHRVPPPYCPRHGPASWVHPVPRSPCPGPSPRLVAGHQPPARAEGQPIQGINPCTSRSDPGVHAGLLGGRGARGTGSRPGWTRASRGHVAGHAGLSRAAPAAPASPKCWARSGCIKDFGAWHPCIRPFLLDEWASCSHCVLTCLASSLDSGGPPDPSSVCCRGPGGRPCSSAPTCQLSARAGPSDGCQVPPLTPQGPHCLLRPPSPEPWGSAGPRPNSGPPSGHGQSAGHYAKAAREAPWVARWALTGPLQVPHLQAVTPKEQN